WRIHHSRLYGNSDGSRRVYLDYPRTSYSGLGQDPSPPVVRTGHERDTAREMKRSKWDQRIQRAEELSATHPFAAEVLLFYKQIATFQKDLYSYVERAEGKPPKENVFDSFHEDLDFDLLLPRFPEFLLLAGNIAPP